MAPMPSERTDEDPYITLVVDGDLPLDPVIHACLGAGKHDIIRASNPKGALAKAGKFQPSLILLNCDLEGITGLELLPELLMQANGAAVIMMSSQPRIADAVEAMKNGAVDYLELPVDAVKLTKVIDAHKAYFVAS
jgi:two-component system response regulator FlrC